MKQEMKTYIGTKTIRACKMLKKEYYKYNGWLIMGNENPESEGYIIEYSENIDDIFWMPAEQFEEEYKLAETWEDRVKIELEDLEEKLEDLNSFLDRLGTPNEYDKSYLLLLEQKKIMNTYVQILKERLQLGAIELNNKEHESSK